MARERGGVVVSFEKDEDELSLDLDVDLLCHLPIGDKIMEGQPHIPGYIQVTHTSESANTRTKVRRGFVKDGGEDIDVDVE